MRIEPTERYLTASMLADLLSCSVSTVWRRCADGTLPRPKKFGASTRWLSSEIDQFFAEAKASKANEE